MPTAKELKEIADKIYPEYRTSNSNTYGEINRRYSEARAAYDKAVIAESKKGGETV